MSDDRIAPDFTTVAVVLCAIVGLVLVAGALPPLTGGGYAEAPDPANPAGDVEFSLGDDGETVSANGSDNSTGDGTEAADRQLELYVSDSDPVPGTDLTVEVTQNNAPVDGAAILFNGEVVGTTDEDGELTAQVPYVQELTVLAQTGDASSAALADAPGDRTAASTAGMDDHTLSQTFDTDSEFDIEVGGGLYPDGRADVAVSIGGSNEVEDATVRFNGDGEQQTDENGTASLPVPDDADTLVIEVSRGELTATEEVALDFDASVDSFPFPFAFGSASVEATTSDGRTIEDDDVTVYILDEANADPTNTELNAVPESARTDLESSPVNIGLPVASSATIVVEAGSATDTVVVENLLRNLGLFVLGTTSILIGGMVTYTRILGRSPSRDVERVGWSLKFGAIDLGWRIKRLGTTYNPFEALARVLEGIVDGIAAMIHALTTFQLPQLSIPSLTVPSLSLPSMPSLSSDDVVAGRSDTEAEDDEGVPMARIGEFDPADPEIPETVELSNRELIAAAWHELAETAGIEDVETTTPGAVARAARQSGLPDDAIEVLTTVFRRIEYGGAEATDERKTQALKALAAIRAAGGDEE